MSKLLFKKILHHNYPTMAQQPVFRVEEFAKDTAKLVRKKGMTIDQIINVQKLVNQIRLIYDSQNQSSRIERIDFSQEALAPGGNQLDVLVAVASNDRNSSGGSDEDLGERSLTSEQRIAAANALEVDINRIFFMMPKVEDKEFYAEQLFFIIGVNSHKIRKYM